MQQSKKLQWLKVLARLPPDQQYKKIATSKSPLIRDLHTVITYVGKRKNLKLSAKQRKLFKDNKAHFKKLTKEKGVRKQRKLLLKRTKGGFLLSAVLPAIISLAATAIPKLLGV